MIAIGTTLGRYEIKSLLGAGGMGEVYLAEDTRLERAVALKVLPVEVARDERRMQRFIQEARAASALNHPNIITIHEIEEIDSVNLIATEYIDGETLRRRADRSPLTIPEAIRSGWTLRPNWGARLRRTEAPRRRSRRSAAGSRPRPPSK
jgi:serine/threonine protein kinase